MVGGMMPKIVALGGFAARRLELPESSESTISKYVTRIGAVHKFICRHHAHIN